MTEKFIETEAETLEEARERVESQIPEGFCLLSEQVLSDGKPKTVEAVADTIEAAFAKAQGQMPANATIMEKKGLSAPEQRVITVESFDQQGAEAEAGRQAKVKFGDTTVVKSLKLTVVGKKGFLGMGKTPNQYEAEVLQQAVAQITYKTKAKIAVNVGKQSWADVIEGLAVQLNTLVEPAGPGLVGQQISVIAVNLHNAAQALAKSGEPYVQYMEATDAGEELLKVYETSNRGGLALMARMSLPEAVFEEFNDIMLAVKANAEYIKRGKEPRDRVRGLKHTDVPERKLAANALSLSGDKQAVPQLIECLNDENSTVRLLVACALGHSCDTLAVEPLIHALLHDNWWGVRSNAALALGSLGDSRAIGPLCRAVKEDTEEDVRKAAREALDKLARAALSKRTATDAS